MKSIEYTKNSTEQEDTVEQSFSNEDCEQLPSERFLAYPYNMLKAISPEQSVYPKDIESRIETILDSTTVFTQRYRRDAECIRCYYKDGLSLAELGSRYGVTGERIRQIIVRAKRKMRKSSILAYLKGETDNYTGKRTQLNTSIHSEDIPATMNNTSADMIIASDEAISISMMARILSEQVKKINGNKLKYADISSWLISTGDLLKNETEGLTNTEPTEQGKNHGIKKGRRKNAKGEEYIGIFLEKEAQIYIESHLNDIIDLMK